MAVKFVKWENEFNTGNARIDEQHQKVFNYISELHTALKLSKDEEEIIRILKGLTDYSIDHFRDEEEEMSQAGYPRFDSHKEEHQIFIDRLLKLTFDMETKNKSINLRLLKFLKVWFSGHILNTDKKFVSYVNGESEKE
jgi:hemerythrin-like metal-binding protein